MLSRKAQFPLPFSSLRTIGGEGGASYIVGAMFTESYAAKAERLAASCRKFSLPFELHEVATVHRSMGVRGTDDLRFTKANFIHHLLTKHRRPILYLDADVEFVAPPVLIGELVQERCDFAIYNWLADEYTDAFRPIDREHRYFRYWMSMDFHSAEQLCAAGITQFYANSFAARALLSRWHRTVAKFPDCGDDDSLNFSYNNMGKRDWLSWILRTRWLPKAYARYVIWMYAEPVINHPEMLGPGSRFSRIRDPRGRKQFYLSRTQNRVPTLLLPRDRIVDTRERMLCKLVDGKLVPLEKTPRQFWI